MTKIKHVFLFDDLDGTNKNHLSFRGWKNETSNIERRRWMPPWPLSRMFRFGVSGRGRMLVSWKFCRCWEGRHKPRGVGYEIPWWWWWVFRSHSCFRKSNTCSVRLQPLKVRWCATHHPLKGLEMIFFSTISTQNVKYIFEEFSGHQHGLSPLAHTHTHTACPTTGGATQHFFLALLSWAENLGISKKRKQQQAAIGSGFVWGSGGMCVWSFVFQHIYVFWKEGG